MSRISDLRNNENNCVNIVKILELFCKGETKYIEMLLKLLPTYGDSIGIKVNAISARTGIDSEKIKQLNSNEIEVLYNLTENMLLMSSIRSFKRFCELNEQKQIDKNDLHSYKTFDEIENDVSDAEEKIRLKELEKQIKKIYEDDEWLILIPLTYESSVKYGYNTKWCTASESTSIQYNSYTRDGVLIYVIHKGVEKVAVYRKYSENNISFWNEADTRTDSLWFNFPHHILDIIKETIDSETSLNKDKTEKPSILDFLNSPNIPNMTIKGLRPNSNLSMGIDVAVPSSIPVITATQQFRGVDAEKMLTEILSENFTKNTDPIDISQVKEKREDVKEKWSLTDEMDRLKSIRETEIEDSILNKRPVFNEVLKNPDFIHKVKDIMGKLR